MGLGGTKTRPATLPYDDWIEGDFDGERVFIKGWSVVRGSLDGDDGVGDEAAERLRLWKGRETGMACIVVRPRG